MSLLKLKEWIDAQIEVSEYYSDFYTQEIRVKLLREVLEQIDSLADQETDKERIAELEAEKFKRENCGNEKCNGINSGIDECIQPLISNLNAANLETTASCCGHGYQPTTIALKDGRWILILPDHESMRKACKPFPDIHGNQPGQGG